MHGILVEKKDQQNGIVIPSFPSLSVDANQAQEFVSGLALFLKATEDAARDSCCSRLFDTAHDHT